MSRCSARPGAVVAIAVATLLGPLTVHAAPRPIAIAIVIDDLGYNAAETRAATQLPGAVACSFLPDAPYTHRYADEAHARGKEVLLHLPLAPIDARKAQPQPLPTGAPDVTRNAELTRMLAAVPHVDGVNNHQGSLATSSRPAMRWLMHALLLHHIGYFIDSYTSARSVAYPMARAYGMPSIRRDVFLDNTATPAAINAQFDELLRQARHHGYAVAIGHPHPATLKVLAQRLPQLAAQGIVLLPPSRLIAHYEPAPQPATVALRYSGRLHAPPQAPTTVASDAP
ncbi:divergent polysaccharide deacetylase family protein [Solimonas marina]|uniref:Divergent polysaccharide deacetylase family protein n=1 Tax=Solimonas marina TaxID=2714601 RepID=A0A969W747_9GAMM|nr:divergent polysaccharide deacetylase family protein [Solimonas marina]NKF20703.1 divergent polysaccharide deacetylase family protein [Solimonas marina]